MRNLVSARAGAMYSCSEGCPVCQNLNYEPFNIWFLERFLLPGMVVLDIGAHAGLFSVCASNQGVDEVHAFEPDLISYEALKENAEKLYPRIIPYKLAVWDKNDLLYLMEADSKAPAQSWVTDKEVCGRRVVQAVALDEFFINRLGEFKVNLVKMDIQGAELMALRGMREILKKNEAVVLLVEFSRAYKKFGYKSADLVMFLEELGFEAFFQTSEWLLRYEGAQAVIGYFRKGYEFLTPEFLRIAQKQGSEKFWDLL